MLPQPQNSRPIRVLWLIKGLGPGGAEALLVSSAKVIDHERFDVEVAYVRPDKDHLVESLEATGITCHLLGYEPGGPIRWPQRLRALLADARFDVVHVHSPLLAGALRLVVPTLPRRQRPAVVTTEHNEWPSFSAPTRLLNGVTAPLDDHRWAVSAQVRDSMWRPIARGSEVLVHGIALDDVAPDLRARERIRGELGIPADAVVAIVVANLRREKDYPNVLRAARRAIDAVPDLFVLAVGQGPLEDEVRGLHTELGLGDRVQLLGYRTDVLDLMAASDIFMLGSAHEGYPISLMEALALGLPVVATAVGGLPDAVHDNVEGLLVPPHDPEALAGALVTVASDPAAHACMGRAAREASQRFDIRRAVEREAEVYAALAAGRADTHGGRVSTG